MNTKQHINAAQFKRMAQVNSVVKRLPFYQNGGASHLWGTKHSKAWGDFGYPLHLDFWFFHAVYSRVGLGRRVVCCKQEACWLTDPIISVGENNDERNADEKVLDELVERLNLFGNLSDLDEMQRVGHYAGAIIRVADDKPLHQPIAGKLRPEQIVQIMPAWEGQLIPGKLETDPNDERYGLPISYTYNQKGVSSNAQRDGGENDTVHHSRVWIWNEGARGNTIFGESALNPVYNALIDWEKIRGAGGEGFWRQAAMRGVLQALEGNTQAPGEDELDELTKVIAEMQQSFDQIPYLGDMQLNTLDTRLDNSEPAGQIILQDVAAGAGWSAKGLVGSQEGRLAGDQDTSGDMRVAQARRLRYLTPQIKRGVLDWFMRYGVIPNRDWRIEWDDLAAPSDKAKLENAKSMAQINRDSVLAQLGPVYSNSEIRLSTGHKAEPEEPLPDGEFIDGATGDEA